MIEEIKARLQRAIEGVKEAARKLIDDPEPVIPEDAFAPPKCERPPKASVNRAVVKSQQDRS